MRYWGIALNPRGSRIFAWLASLEGAVIFLLASGAWTDKPQIQSFGFFHHPGYANSFTMAIKPGTY